MPPLPKVLLVVSAAERDIFLPPPLWGQLMELLPACQWVDSTTLDSASWRELLAREQPEVLLSAWSTHALPDDISALTSGKLRYVCHLAGSVRKLVTEQLIQDGLIVTNWGNAISRTVAEHGLMMAIALLRRAHTWNLDMHTSVAWKDHTVVFDSLYERRVGIHGFGVISQDLRRLLRPFDTPVMTYSPSVPDEVLREHDVTRSLSLEQLFAENDVIFELAALTPRSVGMVREEHLRSIPPRGVFINIGRGRVVDEAALVRVAQTTDLQIALDVFNREPLPQDSPLRGLRNVMLTPHIAGPTLDRSQDSGRLALCNLKAYLAGQPLEAIMSAEIYARST
jgi:phosphoglycerate dehydrogenase-like enzyme